MSIELKVLVRHYKATRRLPQHTLLWLPPEIYAEIELPYNSKFEPKLEIDARWCSLVDSLKKIIRKSEMMPQEKSIVPMTTAQEIGWDTEALVSDEHACSFLPNNRALRMLNEC